jgi:hypothetical protein
MPTSESIARQQIDQLLAESGWTIQDRTEMNLYASRGVHIREFTLESGFADYFEGKRGKPNWIGFRCKYLISHFHTDCS